MIRNPKPLRGVTFLEVMIVVVILGLLVAIALPRMGGTRSNIGLRTATRDIASAGLYARQVALARGETVRLRFYPETNEWRLVLPEPQDDRYSWRRSSSWRDDDAPRTPEEGFQFLPETILFQQLNRGDESLFTRRNNDENRRRGARRSSLRDDEYIDLTFYPNGTSNQMAIEITNNRGRSMTVDFSRATGKPEIYEGAPKSLAQKLRDRGLNPRDYGIYEEGEFIDENRQKYGEGFYMAAGMDADERVAYYEDVVTRIMNRSRTSFEIEKSGSTLQDYYQGAAAWGGR